MFAQVNILWIRVDFDYSGQLNESLETLDHDRGYIRLCWRIEKYSLEDSVDQSREGR